MGIVNGACYGGIAERVSLFIFLSFENEVGGLGTDLEEEYVPDRTKTVWKM